jgi:hypothetical protein
MGQPIHGYAKLTVGPEHICSGLTWVILPHEVAVLYDTPLTLQVTLKMQWIANAEVKNFDTLRCSGHHHVARIDS